MGEEVYNQALQEQFGIDLSELMRVNQNPGGVYYEVAYLMSRLISHPHVTRVMESGAGLSTLLYATVAKQHNKFFVSLEDKEEWANKTNSHLRSIPDRVGDFQTIYTDSDPSKCPVFTEPFQLAWIDGNIAWHSNNGMPADCLHRPGTVQYYKDVLTDALIIFDDGEDTHCRIAIDRVMRNMGRDPSTCFIWNPLGRRDRNQWVCPPPDGSPLLDVLVEIADMNR